MSLPPRYEISSLEKLVHVYELIEKLTNSRKIYSSKKGKLNGAAIGACASTVFGASTDFFRNKKHRLENCRHHFPPLLSTEKERRANLWFRTSYIYRCHSLRCRKHRKLKGLKFGYFYNSTSPVTTKVSFRMEPKAASMRMINR